MSDCIFVHQDHISWYNFRYGTSDYIFLHYKIKRNFLHCIPDCMPPNQKCMMPCSLHLHIFDHTFPNYISPDRLWINIFVCISRHYILFCILEHVWLEHNPLHYMIAILVHDNIPECSFERRNCMYNQPIHNCAHTVSLGHNTTWILFLLKSSLENTILLHCSY